jgi:multidrug resistance efflux pump
MNTTRRSHRFFWLLGIGLLVGTAAGAGWVLNQAPAGTPVPREGERGRLLPGADSITCIGYVDVPNGTTPLYPVQPGRVTEVWVEEGDTVWEGALLFRMDDRVARIQLREAQEDLKAAKALKAKVERERILDADRIAGLTAALEAAKANAEAQAYDVEIQRKLKKGQIQGGSAEALGAAEAKEKAAQQLVKVKEAELRALKDYDYGPELRQAEANIRAKEWAVKKARLAYIECDVYAPADGAVLRVFIAPDQMLGSDPKVPAVQFCPAVPRIIRAEVQQEWGSRIEAGQLAVIEDDTRAGTQWSGRVARVSDWYSRRRSPLQEPFQFNDVRTLECLVSINPGQRHLRIGQRMRVIIKQGGP